MHANRLYQNLTAGATGLLLSLFIIAASFAMNVFGVSRASSTTLMLTQNCNLGNGESDTRFIDTTFNCTANLSAKPLIRGEVKRCRLYFLLIVTRMIRRIVLAQENNKGHKQLS